METTRHFGPGRVRAARDVASGVRMLEIEPAAGARPADQDDREVVVRQNRTGLDARKDYGVDMMWDCLRGECGLCAGRVLEVDGELDHRDVFLDEEQQVSGETLLTCVSRA